MRKKGFTLIELLAVIIILAIVALVATPIILDVIDDARKSAGLSETKIIYSGINNYCMEAKLKKQLNGTDNICEDGVTVDEVSQMINLGNSKVTNVKYENGKVTELTVESNNKIIELQPNGSFTINGESTEEPVDLGNDTSGANKPDLFDNMVAVVYNEETLEWKVSDQTQPNWYNYDNKEWANAVVLTEGTTKNVGDTVNENDIALWYVWVPRYKYQLFNVNNEGVYEQIIAVEFEQNIETTGTVTCTDAINQVDANGNKISEICTNAENGNWYTHPAFTFGDEELTGFWMGKFELSTSDDNCNTNPSSSNCYSTLPVTIKPNVSSWTYANLGTYYAAVKDINNIYNISNADSHLIKNMEWGAVAYLKQSQYGLGLIDISVNDYYRGDVTKTKLTTGCGAIASSYPDKCNPYDSDNGKLASTTGNIYGVYDMSGGAGELVMGNMVDENGDFFQANAYFYDELPDSKYYDKYTYDSSAYTYSRGKLGDGTKEILRYIYIATSQYVESSADSWYYDNATFPYCDGGTGLYSNSSWFMRGGRGSSFRNNSNHDLGIFSNEAHSAYNAYDIGGISSRAVLVKK